VIFLSYSWKDQAAAHAIDDRLRGQGFDVWIDFRQLNVESDITYQLDAAIRHCSLFVAIRPTNNDSSPWMAAEFLMAWKYFKPILQIMPVWQG
jgi:hypothetical protein